MMKMFTVYEGTKIETGDPRVFRNPAKAYRDAESRRRSIPVVNIAKKGLDLDEAEAECRKAYVAEIEDRLRL